MTKLENHKLDISEEDPNLGKKYIYSRTDELSITQNASEGG